MTAGTWQIQLKADDETVRQRMLARAPSNTASDDEPVIRRRLELYHEMTEPISWPGTPPWHPAHRRRDPHRRGGRWEILAALEVMRPVIRNVPEKTRRWVDLTTQRRRRRGTATAVAPVGLVDPVCGSPTRTTRSDPATELEFRDAMCAGWASTCSTSSSRALAMLLLNKGATGTTTLITVPTGCRP